MDIDEERSSESSWVWMTTASVYAKGDIGVLGDEDDKLEAE